MSHGLYPECLRPAIFRRNILRIAPQLLSILDILDDLHELEEIYNRIVARRDTVRISLDFLFRQLADSHRDTEKYIILARTINSSFSAAARAVDKTDVARFCQSLAEAAKSIELHEETLLTIYHYPISNCIEKTKKEFRTYCNRFASNISLLKCLIKAIDTLESSGAKSARELLKVFFQDGENLFKVYFDTSVLWRANILRYWPLTRQRLSRSGTPLLPSKWSVTAAKFHNVDELVARLGRSRSFKKLEPDEIGGWIHGKVGPDGLKVKTMLKGFADLTRILTDAHLLQ